MAAPTKNTRSGSLISALLFVMSSSILSKSGTRFMLKLVPSLIMMPFELIPDTTLGGMPSVWGVTVLAFRRSLKVL